MPFSLPDRTTSLKRRLSLGLTGAITLAWLAATLIGSAHVREEINEVSDSALQEVVQRVLPLAYMEVLHRDTADQTSDVVTPVGPHREYITYIVRDQTGRVLMQSHDAEPARFPSPPRNGFEDGPDTRFYTDTAAKGAVSVTAAERPGHRQGAIRDATFALLSPLMVLFPLVLFITWWLVGRAFRPVTQLGQAIQARGGGNLTPVETGSLPPEIRPVGLAVNALLERLRRAIDTERSFTANSAHELRTPVAGALAQTQRLISELEDGPTKARAREVEGSLRQLARLSEKLLQLAKAEGAALLAPEPQDLRPVLALIIRDFGPQAPISRGAEDDGKPFISRLDLDAFGILARNLIENALKHGDSTGVEVSLASGSGLIVRNGGTVLPEATLAGMMERFSRGPTNAKGTGLGLSIAAAIARGVGGELTIHSPAPGHADGVEVHARF